MKRLIATFLSILSLNAWAETRCQGLSLCLHTNMPLLYQDHGFLSASIRSGGYPNYVSDKGNCGPTTGAMVHSTMSNDVQGYSSNADLAQLYARVFTTGQYMRTDWMNGGTDPGDIDRGMKYYTLLSSRLYSYESRTKFPERSDFVRRMPALTVTIGKPQWWWYKKVHALAMNGYEGYMVKLYDPWQRIYNVDSFDGKKISNPTGWGFVSYFGPGFEVIKAQGGFQPSMDRGFMSNGLEGGFSGGEYSTPTGYEI